MRGSTLALRVLTVVLCASAASLGRAEALAPEPVGAPNPGDGLEALLASPTMAAGPRGAPGRLASVEGTVRLLRAGEGAEGWAAENSPVSVGDLLVTGADGWATVEASEDWVVVLAPRSEAWLVEAGADGRALGIDGTSHRSAGGGLTLELLRGRLVACSARGAAAARVRTPDLEALLEADGRYRLEAGSAGTRVVIDRGRARARTDRRSRQGAVGSVLEVRAGRRAVRRSRQVRVGDELDRRSVASCLLLQRDPDLPRLVGSSCLASAGRWVRVRGARCWRPPVSSGWAPYSCGSWYRDRRWGWTHVPCEPWGWVTHHHGTWIHDAAWGWVWRPGVRWHAHRVTFWRDARNVYWCPRGDGPEGRSGERDPAQRTAVARAALHQFENPVVPSEPVARAGGPVLRSPVAGGLPGTRPGVDWRSPSAEPPAASRPESPRRVRGTSSSEGAGAAEGIVGGNPRRPERLSHVPPAPSRRPVGIERERPAPREPASRVRSPARPPRTPAMPGPASAPVVRQPPPTRQRTEEAREGSPPAVTPPRRGTGDAPPRGRAVPAARRPAETPRRVDRPAPPERRPAARRAPTRREPARRDAPRAEPRREKDGDAGRDRRHGRRSGSSGRGSS